MIHENRIPDPEFMADVKILNRLVGQCIKKPSAKFGSSS